MREGGGKRGSVHCEGVTHLTNWSERTVAHHRLLQYMEGSLGAEDGVQRRGQTEPSQAALPSRHLARGQVNLHSEGGRMGRGEAALGHRAGGRGRGRGRALGTAIEQVGLLQWCGGEGVGRSEPLRRGSCSHSSTLRMRTGGGVPF